MKRSALALRVEQIRFADLTQHPYRFSTVDGQSRTRREM